VEYVVVKFILLKVSHQCREEPTLFNPELRLKFEFEAHFKDVVAGTSYLTHGRRLDVK
jgi:hypothetical protein